MIIYPNLIIKIQLFEGYDLSYIYTLD